MRQEPICADASLNACGSGKLKAIYLRYYRGILLKYFHLLLSLLRSLSAVAAFLRSDEGWW